MAVKKIIINGENRSVDIKALSRDTFEIGIVEGDVQHVKVLEHDSGRSMLRIVINNTVYQARLLINTKDNCRILRLMHFNKDFHIGCHQQQFSSLSRSASHNVASASSDRSTIFAAQLLSPLGGRVISVLVHQGEVVTSAQPLIVIESMKMENTIVAPSNAIVKTLSIVPGNLVQPNQVLMTFEKKGVGDARDQNRDEEAKI
jgi:biotin carboxyl carrier protein